MTASYFDYGRHLTVHWGHCLSLHPLGSLTNRVNTWPIYSQPLSSWLTLSKVNIWVNKIGQNLTLIWRSQTNATMHYCCCLVGDLSLHNCCLTLDLVFMLHDALRAWKFVEYILVRRNCWTTRLYRHSNTRFLCCYNCHKTACRSVG